MNVANGWECALCGAKHALDHEGICFAGGAVMVCCSCETRAKAFAKAVVSAQNTYDAGKLRQVLGHIIHDASGDIHDPHKRLWPIRAQNYREAMQLLSPSDVQPVPYPFDRVPKGYKTVEAYRRGDELVVLGQAEGEHDCDAMGCGSVGPHVVARLKLGQQEQE